MPCISVFLFLHFGDQQKMEPYHEERVTEVINVRQVLQNWDDDILHEYCKETPTITSETDILSSDLDLPRETLEELASVCSPDTLLCGQEPHDKNLLIVDIPTDIKLECVEHQRQELQRRENPVYRKTMNRKMKYKILDSLLLTDDKDDEDIPAECRVQSPDVVLTVQIHKPIVSSVKLVVEHTFSVLGRQKLTDLRDRIRCANDLAVAGEFSNNPDLQAEYCAKDLYKSGFFYIEGVFYNDMREDDCRDYSKEVIEWAKDKDGYFGPFTKQKMEDTTFLDLKLRIGQPYLYMHQGNCEHLIIFSDLRLLHPSDPQHIDDYPFMLKRISKKRTVCRVCQTMTAKWITYNDMLCPETPSFFCENCFKALHYDSNGEKVAEFEAYKFLDGHAVV